MLAIAKHSFFHWGLRSFDITFGVFIFSFIETEVLCLLLAAAVSIKTRELVYLWAEQMDILSKIKEL